MQEYNEWDWEGFSQEEIAEIENYEYDEIGIDRAIEEIKDIDEDIARLGELAKQRIEKLKGELELKTAKLIKRKEYHLNNIKSFALQSDNKKETKTQYKLPMISGDIIIKKSAEKFVKPEKLQDEVIRQELMPYQKEEFNVKLNWAEMKKNLEIRIVDGQKIVYDKILNKDVSHLVAIETTPEEVVIK